MIFSVVVVAFEYTPPFVTFVQLPPELVLSCHWYEVGLLLNAAVNDALEVAQTVEAEGCVATVGTEDAG